MNKKFTVVFFLFISVFGFSQQADTINININNSATIVFNTGIDLVVIGNNAVIEMSENGTPLYKYYDKLLVNNMVIIRAKVKNIPTSTLTIKLADGSIYFFLIRYKINCTKHFYNIENDIENNIKINKNRSLDIPNKKVDFQEKDTISILSRRTNILRTKKPNIDDIAEIKGKVIFKIANIMYDKNYTYIKLLVANTSANNYNIDGIMYKYIEGKKRLINKKEVENIKWLKAVYSDLSINNEIREQTNEKFCFVIPIYNIASGYLLIKIIEKHGTRNVDLYINSKFLQKANIF